eukprot:11307493-Alexandrium_andersonii.AAC.1
MLVRCDELFGRAAARELSSPSPRTASRPLRTERPGHDSGRPQWCNNNGAKRASCTFSTHKAD